jgi:hypothetical protein
MHTTSLLRCVPVHGLAPFVRRALICAAASLEGEVNVDHLRGYTLQQTARRLGVAIRVVRRAVCDGFLHTVRIGPAVRVAGAEIERVERNRLARRELSRKCL